jgi:soluble P-type ATPase
LINRLQLEGITTYILSGDRKEAVEGIGRTVGIRSENRKSSLTPQEKAGIISTLQEEGHRVAMVIYCGVLFLFILPICSIGFMGLKQMFVVKSVLVCSFEKNEICTLSPQLKKINLKKGIVCR